MEDQLVNNASVCTTCPVKHTTIELTRNGAGTEIATATNVLGNVANLAKNSSGHVVSSVTFVYSKVTFDRV